jgi:GT2 family glycosyltransferase
VLNTDYPSYEVIIVDSGSTDGSLPLIKETVSRTSRAKLIRTGNVGAPHSFNIGAASAKGEYLVKLDDDVIVHPKWLLELIKVLESDTSIWAAQSVGSPYNDENFNPEPSGSYIDRLGWIHWKNVNDIDDAFFPVAFALAIKKSHFFKLGGFYPEFFIYFDEIDLGWRIKLHGYRTVVVRGSVVRHAGPRKGPVTIERSLFTLFHEGKNHIATLLINYEFKNLLLYLPPLIVERFISALRSRRCSNMLGFLKAAYWNVENLSLVFSRRKFVNRTIRRVRDKDIKKIMLKHHLSARGKIL